MKKHRSVLLVSLLTVVSVILTAAPMASAQSANPSFSGQAVGVKATVLGLPPIDLSDTGALPSSGGAQHASLLSASVPGVLSAEVLHASTIGQGDRSRSEASLANLNLTVGGNSISAGFLTANATAVCSKGGASVTGSPQIVGLVINGQTIVVSAAPNQTVTLPNGEVVLNEQQTAPGSITVNALHVMVNGVADVIVSSAHADISHCPSQPNCNTSDDFITGGGRINLNSSRANFGVAGGIKNGSFWGHLEYIDHGTGMKVHGTAVTAYSPTGTTSRHIEGTAEMNGQGVKYEVDVADNGEPGNMDTFTIKLSTGYGASGKLGAGNIQLHRPCQ